MRSSITITVPPAWFRLAAASFVLLGLVAAATAQESFTATSEQVNKKMVKLFGAGGFKGLPSYGTGILVSKDGYILTINNHILNSVDIRVHLHDGRLYRAKVKFREPELDIALLKIEDDVDDLEFYFDIAAAVKVPPPEVGDWILCFSNAFQIATRSEPMSVQRGNIMAIAPLKARRGVNDPPYMGEAYFIDTVASNPGAAGGIITNRKGELLGIIGRELKSTLSDTWVNYAMPITAKVDIVRDDGKTEVVDVASFVKDGMNNKYHGSSGKLKKGGLGAYSGIILVPNAVSTTPPYVDEVIPGSPAAKAKLQPDDLIVYVDGELVQTVKAFREILKQSSPGVVLQLEVQRGNQLKTIKLTLEDFPKTK
jgi:S1-C subfamily serine protease